jgi:hypothetical protein
MARPKSRLAALLLLPGDDPAASSRLAGRLFGRAIGRVQQRNPGSFRRLECNTDGPTRPGADGMNVIFLVEMVKRTKNGIEIGLGNVITDSPYHRQIDQLTVGISYSVVLIRLDQGHGKHLAIGYIKYLTQARTWIFLCYLTAFRHLYPSSSQGDLEEGYFQMDLHPHNRPQ